MDGEGFFVTLPSNSSRSFYPNNTIANFTTKLPKPFQLNEPYEVGLIEIQFPKTWTNFSQRDADFIVFDKKSNRRACLTATPGFYTTMPQIVTEINKRLTADDMNYIQLQYNSITNRICILPVRDVQLTFRGKLAQMLGFTPGEVFESVYYQMMKYRQSFLLHQTPLYGYVQYVCLHRYYRLSNCGRQLRTPFKNRIYWGAKQSNDYKNVRQTTLPQALQNTRRQH